MEANIYSAKLAAAMSIDEAAHFIGIGRSLVYAEIKKGKLRARKAGRRTIVLPEDAEAYRKALPELNTAA